MNKSVTVLLLGVVVGSLAVIGVLYRRGDSGVPVVGKRLPEQRLPVLKVDEPERPAQSGGGAGQPPAPIRVPDAGVTNPSAAAPEAAAAAGDSPIGEPESNSHSPVVKRTHRGGDASSPERQARLAAAIEQARRYGDATESRAARTRAGSGLESGLGKDSSDKGLASPDSGQPAVNPPVETVVDSAEVRKLQARIGELQAESAAVQESLTRAIEEVRRAREKHLTHFREVRDDILCRQTEEGFRIVGQKKPGELSAEQQAELAAMQARYAQELERNNDAFVSASQEPGGELGEKLAAYNAVAKKALDLRADIRTAQQQLIAAQKVPVRLE